jgi:hypothetical protein
MTDGAEKGPIALVGTGLRLDHDSPAAAARCARTAHHGKEKVYGSIP